MNLVKFYLKHTRDKTIRKSGINEIDKISGIDFKKGYGSIFCKHIQDNTTV
ncbi:hypothetical protein SAMN05660649_03816 [Desulfotomaculum arcticum]|uniref:Uncharacterized protein n=1 Tax=Desulfotruncus arcticus DSM 17038 TaxID=1121424 RepID=A0A1I2X8A9_9FIRM|nr:hypothetical protein SAMN05660649_03816 [Desulfotomaculum arcticum] [Desulfotruncus arcticus DSM 17038]